MSALVGPTTSEHPVRRLAHHTRTRVEEDRRRRGPRGPLVNLTAMECDWYEVDTTPRGNLTESRNRDGVSG